MTGLDASTDTILSISCFLTTSDLTLLEPGGYHATIQHSAETLSKMSAWCLNTHSSTGLMQACIKSQTNAATASADLLAYIKQHIPPNTALLAGNSVHVDKLFLMCAPWTPVVQHLHYRILDVSAIKEGVRRWCPDEILEGQPVKKLGHTAREDVLESLAEADYYMRLFRGLKWTRDDR